jgi:hypothetical protein
MIECNSALEFRDPAHLSLPIIFVCPPLVERTPLLTRISDLDESDSRYLLMRRSFRPLSQTSSKLNSPSEAVVTSASHDLALAWHPVLSSSSPLLSSLLSLDAHTHPKRAVYQTRSSAQGRDRGRLRGR